MRKITLAKFRSPFPGTGRFRLERGNSMDKKLNVNEEYKQVFRTQSYTDIFSKVQRQLRGTSFDKLTSSPSLSCYAHLSDFLLEPKQETLIDMFEASNFHYLLVDYFEASLEACNVCELLLQSIQQTRKNYKIIKRVRKRIHNFTDYNINDVEQCHTISQELASFTLLNNPLSAVSPSQFHDIHDSYGALFRKLTSKSKKIRRKARQARFFKKAAGIGLIILHSAIATTLLVLAVHSIVGVVAAPALVGCFLSLHKKRIKTACRGLGVGSCERHGAQLDTAARGLYILINDFDSMSQLVRRLHDQVEHSSAIADMCVRNGKGEMLREAVKEFDIQEKGLVDQLKELEEHIYLCFVNINRSRRLVIQEVLVP